MVGVQVVPWETIDWREDELRTIVSLALNVVVVELRAVQVDHPTFPQVDIAVDGYESRYEILGLVIDEYVLSWVVMTSWETDTRGTGIIVAADNGHFDPRRVLSLTREHEDDFPTFRQLLDLLP